MASYKKRKKPRFIRRPDLSEKKILAWADAYFARAGKWPRKDSGHVYEDLNEKWWNVDRCLREGFRGLHGGSSLARLLAEKRGVRNRGGLPPFCIPRILDWADSHHARTGQWPKQHSGVIGDDPTETWAHVNEALIAGNRGLPGDSSLAQILAKHRGVRNIKDLACLTFAKILAWADAHHARTEQWPNHKSGPILEAPGETWMAIDIALGKGGRGLTPGFTLARLLSKRRGVRYEKDLPPLSVQKILTWADAHHNRTGAWPRKNAGLVIGAGGEAWDRLDAALRIGRRGLPGGSSLSLLLAKHRGVVGPLTYRLPLTVEQILSWADAFRARMGKWPNVFSGPIPGGQGKSWRAVDRALRRGWLSLPRGSSLAKLLGSRRDVRNKLNLPRLSPKLILGWAKMHFQRTGKWPAQQSGSILDAPGETWTAVDSALLMGCRGLPGGSSLARLLAEHGLKRNIQELPPFSCRQILQWADAHHKRTGQWPNIASGPVLEAPAEQWRLIDHALRQGHRGLAGGSSLARLLANKRGLRNPSALPPLTTAQVLKWAKSYLARHGSLPSRQSGPIAGVPGESWDAVNSALRDGKRGMPGGTSLARFLAGRFQVG